MKLSQIFNVFAGRRSPREEYLRRHGLTSRWARPPEKNTAEWLGMFSVSPRLAVVDRIASDLSSVGGHLLRVEPDGTETELTRHPFLDFMERPNPLYEMTNAAIWRLNEIYLLLVGESFILIERDESLKPVELWNVPPHWVKMTPYLGSPGYTITSTSGVTMTVPVEDMFIMKQLNPLDPFMRGLGLAQSVADEVEIDEYASKFQKRFFYNDATPPTIVSLPDNATEEQLDAFEAKWNSRFRGVDNSHKAAFMNGAVSVAKISSNDTRELGFNESRLSMRNAVLEHFGVPKELMGITENSNRSTAESAQYIYAKNVLTPRLVSREAAINTQLLPLFGSNLVWRYEPVIPHDKEFDKARALDGFNAGVLTRNEARKLLDLPVIDGGDVFKTSINDLYIGQDDDPVAMTRDLLEDSRGGGTETAGPRTANSQTSGDLHTEISKSMLSAKSGRFNAIRRKETAARRKNERAFEAAVTRHFANQKRDLAKKLGLSGKAEADDLFESLNAYLLEDGTFDPELWEALGEAEQARLANAIADGLLDWRGQADELARMFAPLWKEAMDDGAEIIEEEYTGIARIQRPEFTAAAKDYSAQRVTQIEGTTRKHIANIVTASVAQGDSEYDLRQWIVDEMDTTASRAKLIAQQETSTALNVGQFDLMAASGATTKTWNHMDAQLNPRDGSHGKVNHVRLDGETVPINGKFSNGLRFPCDPECGSAAEVINCRCYLTYGFGNAGTASGSTDHSRTSSQTPESEATGQGAGGGQSNGSGGSGSGKPGVPEEVGTVDFSDKKAVVRRLEDAERSLEGLDHEVNYTVTTDGKVWRVSGESSTVHPETIPSSLKGSYSYHNHPAAVTHYSFSADDVAFFIEHGEAFAKASDGRYEYVMRRTEKTLEKSYDEVYRRFNEVLRTDVFRMKWGKVIDPDLDEYHAAIQILGKELGFEYERIKKI